MFVKITKVKVIALWFESKVEGGYYGAILTDGVAVSFLQEKKFKELNNNDFNLSKGDIKFISFDNPIELSSMGSEKILRSQGLCKNSDAKMTVPKELEHLVKK